MDLRKLMVVFTAALLSLLILSCSSPATREPGILAGESPASFPEGLPRTEAEVPRVSLDDTIAAIESGEAVIVDVRSPEAYQASHIPGAISIPLGEVETNPDGLPLEKEQWIITYCT